MALKLLTFANSKLRKGETQGYMTFVLHLAPANLSGHEVCRYRTKECTMLCLNTAGRGGIFKPDGGNKVQAARIRKTKAMFARPFEFKRDLVADIEFAIRYALKRGFIPCFRLNGTSDLRWENIAVIRDGRAFRNMFDAFSGVQFYDYTKYPYSERETEIPNYHLTFSYAETLSNRRNASQWLRQGHNIAVVFATPDFPEAFVGHPTVSGEVSDLRFNDTPNSIIALTAKGRARKARLGGFVQAC